VGFARVSSRSKSAPSKSADATMVTRSTPASEQRTLAGRWRGGAALGARHDGSNQAEICAGEPRRMAARFDFSRLRVHAEGREADVLAADLGATAFTRGRDIYFRNGAWPVTCADGERQERSKQRCRGLQAKLKVNEPGDGYEQEADQIADRVMTAPAHHAVAGALHKAAEELPDMTEDHGRAIRLGSQVTQRLLPQAEGGSARTRPAYRSNSGAVPTVRSGTKLPREVRSHFEQRLGHDFSQVRVHADGEAAAAARAMQARAYTIGPDIVFGSGQYAPGTEEGSRLLAHELVHVVQQNIGSSTLEASTVPGGGAEKTVGRSAIVVPVTGTCLRVQRKPDIPPGYEGRSGLVQLAVEELDGKARGEVLLDILAATGSHEQRKLWALELQSRRQKSGTNYLYLFFKELADYNFAVAIMHVGLLRADGIVVGMTSGSYQSLAYLDPKVTPPLPFPVDQLNLERYVDNFAAVAYDLGYKPAERGFLSTTLQVSYADGAKIDVSIWDISDNVDAAWENAIVQSYVGPGGRVFPSRLSRNTVPGLWAAKHKALARMNAYNQDFETFVSIGTAGLMANLPIGPVEIPMDVPVEAPPLPGAAEPRSGRVSTAGQAGVSETPILAVAEPPGTKPPAAAKPPTTRFHATSQGDIAINPNIGGLRELRVAEEVGGKVAKIGKTDVKVRTPSGVGIKVDVFGPDGELILVGGPGDAAPNKIGALGDSLNRLKQVADAHGVKAMAYFEEGTPDVATNLAKKWLGEQNVHLFK
jgi:uncharacterized protein DUF4157